MEKGKFRPPHLQNRLIDIDETWTLQLSIEGHSPRKISFRSDDVGGLGEYPIYRCRPTVSFCVFLSWSYDAFPPKDAPLEVSLTCMMSPHLGGLISKTQFWGLNI